MAMNWPELSCYSTASEAHEVCPKGWKVLQISSLFEQLKIGKRFDKKTATSSSGIPVIDQSSEGCIGYHREAPGIDASHDRPVVTFANHTCEMRLMREPFSVIQNVFPLAPTSECASPLALYYLTKGRVKLEEYKGHFPVFRESYICVPTVLEQREIASILGALDDKIELNRRMAATLEEMARALYRSWFVDFDPVKAKVEGMAPTFMDEATAALFPDRFGDDGLPEGWRRHLTSEIVSLTKGRSYKSKELQPSSTALISLKSFQRGGGYRPDGLKSYTGVYKPAQVVQPGEIVISLTDVTQAAELIGRATFARSSRDFEILVASLDVGILRALDEKRTPREFLHQAFNSEEFLTHALAHTSGTTVLHLAKEAIPSFLMLVPDQPVIEAFESLVAPMRADVFRLEHESQALVQLRDTLLPKLMSGELRVGEARDRIEEVA